MRFYYSIILLLLLPAIVLAQRPLSADAEKIKKQYGYLNFERRAALSHVDYLTAFPNDKTTFLDVFYPWQLDQLYELRHKYMDALKMIGEQYPERVLAKGITLGKELQGNEDIVGELQEIIIDLANSHTAEFVSEAKKIKKDELPKLGRFLADAQNRAGVQTLIEHLKGQKEGKIADAITKAIADKTKEAE